MEHTLRCHAQCRTMKVSRKLKSSSMFRTTLLCMMIDVTKDTQSATEDYYEQVLENVDIETIHPCTQHTDIQPYYKTPWKD